MPPPKKAAKKAPKKAAKKTAGHHHDKHHQANDLRRAYEHMGRVAVLRQTSKSSATDAVAELTASAQRAIKDGHSKDAADLLRASEHLSFAVLAGQGRAPPHAIAQGQVDAARGLISALASEDRRFQLLLDQFGATWEYVGDDGTASWLIAKIASDGSLIWPDV